MSSIYVNDYSNRIQPSIDERNTLAELVVGCWTKCLAIMIEHTEEVRINAIVPYLETFLIL